MLEVRGVDAIAQQQRPDPLAGQGGLRNFSRRRLIGRRQHGLIQNGGVIFNVGIA
jgi:hypothetical protein